MYIFSTTHFFWQVFNSYQNIYTEVTEMLHNWYAMHTFLQMHICIQ